jgi:hypothetical protein
MVLPHPWGNLYHPDKFVVGYLECISMGHCQALGLPIPQQGEGCLWMQALKQQLIEEGQGIQPALVLQVGEKTSIEAENPGHGCVPMISSVKGHLRQGVVDLAHSDDMILSFE